MFRVRETAKDIAKEHANTNVLLLAEMDAVTPVMEEVKTTKEDLYCPSSVSNRIFLRLRHIVFHNHK